MTASPSSIRKSERLEKQNSSTPVIRRSGRLEKQSTPSPLRRSDRGRISRSSTSNRSKGSEKASTPEESKREKKEKTIKQLNLETENVNLGETSGVKRKTMDARTYKGLFTRKGRNSIPGNEGKLQKHDVLPQVDSAGNSRCSKQIEDKNERHECIMRVAEDPREEPLEGATSSMRESDAKISEPNIISATGNSKIPELSACMARSPGCNSELETGARRMQAGNSVSTVAEAGPTASLENEIYGFVGNCAVCSNRRRSDYDSPEEELCSCRATFSWASGDTSRNKVSGNLEVHSSSESVEGRKCIPKSKEILSVSEIDVENVCEMCRKGGNLLCCGGESCGRCYHLRCLDSSLVDDTPDTPGIWHCPLCVKKKIEFGVHTVSKTVESIWDVKEVVLSDMEGVRRQKQYLVKYQGLAHVYNQWVSESLMLQESPSLVEKFNREHQLVTWNPKWRLPHRLLRKRRLISCSHQDEYRSSNIDVVPHCQFEWLVKWCGLDYEHATWEVDCMKFLHSPHGQRLMEEYEIRHQKTRKLSDKSSKGAFVELQKLPSGGSFRADYNMLNNMNKLREFWYKSPSAIVFDEQDRLETVILFIKTLSEHHRPFLVVTTPNALSQWEAKFMQIAPTVDVVVYSGNRDTRITIRTLEFYDDGGGILLQVLLSTMEVVSEDLEAFREIRWEAVIVDECQSESMNKNVKLIKVLRMNMMLLLCSSQLKDVVAEYQYVLSLLDPPGDLKLNLSDNLVNLKESLSHFTAYGSKSESSKFVEYWVPVPLSNLQLEQYCSTLLTNTITLCSPLKKDEVGALLDILKTLRKCCSHPYTVDLYTQYSVIQGLQAPEVLDVGIRASGKLHLLDLILSEIRSLKLRVLLLFQSGGSSEGTPIGSILDDFLEQRFGHDSYEGFVTNRDNLDKKSQAIIERFNSKEGGRFVFLLESRACMPSIKLSVDIVVMFNTDWNPANDMKALQRISIVSDSAQIKVFRLYSPYTFEEKMLIHSKHNKNVESNLQSVTRAFNDSILMWGASYLFKRLDEFHAEESTVAARDVSSGHQGLLDDIVKDFMAKLLDVSKNNSGHNSMISKVLHGEGVYHTDCLLLGERDVKLTDGEDRRAYWKMLLEGRNPQWKFLSGSSTRNRKRVHYAENDEPAKKHQKGLDSCQFQSFLPEPEERSQAAGSKTEASVAANQSEFSPISVSTALADVNKANPHSREDPSSHETDIAHLEERTPNEQKSLHVLLRAEMAELCDVLKLSKGVKWMALNFLEYVMENHNVNNEQVSILQAFKMSLCWIAASIMKGKIDRGDSLNLAKQTLNFECTKEEIDIVYEKLRPLKSTFLQLLRNKNGLMFKGSVESASKDITGQPLKVGEPPSQIFMRQNVKVEAGESSFDLGHPQAETIDQITEYNVGRKKFKKFQKRCDKHMLKLRQKQEEELREFHNLQEQKRLQLENEHQMESDFIRETYEQTAMGVDELKLADIEFEKKLKEHELIMEMQLKELEERHSAAIEKESKRVADLLEKMQLGMNKHRNVDDQHIHGSEYCEMGSSEGFGCITSKCSENNIGSGTDSLERSPDRIVDVSRAGNEIVAHVPESSDDTPVLVNSVSDVALEIVPAEPLSVTRDDESKKSGHTSGLTLVVDAQDACSSLPVETSSFLLNSNSDKALETVPVGTSSLPSFDQPEKEDLLSQTSQEITPTCSFNGAKEIVCVNLATCKGQNRCEISVSGENNEIVSRLPSIAGSGIGNNQTSDSGALVENTENGTGNSMGFGVIGNQEGGAHSSISGTALSRQIESVDPVTLQTVPSSESPPGHIEDLPITGGLRIPMGSSSLAEHEAGFPIQSDCEAQVTASCEQLRPASSCLLPDHGQHVAEAVHQVHVEGTNSILNSDACPQIFAGSVEVVREAIPLDAGNLMHLDSECYPTVQQAHTEGNNSLQISEACTRDNLAQSVSDFSSSVCSQSADAEAVQQGHVEGSQSRQASGASMQLVEASPVFSHQAFSHDGENLVQLTSHRSSPVCSQPTSAETVFQNNIEGSNSVQTSDASVGHHLVQPASHLSTPVCPLPPTDEAVCQGQIEESNLLQASIQLVEPCSGPSDKVVSQNSENLVPPASSCFTPVHGRLIAAEPANRCNIEMSDSLQISEDSNLSSSVCRQPTIAEAVDLGPIAGSSAVQTSSDVSIQLVDRLAELLHEVVPQNGENLVQNGENLAQNGENLVQNGDKLVHPASTCSSPVNTHPSVAEFVDQGHIETANSLRGNEVSSPMVEGSIMQSQLSVSLSRENSVLPPLTESRSSLNLQTRTNSDCSAELSVVASNIVVPTQVVHSAAEVINQAPHWSMPNVAVAEGSAHLSVHHHHLSSWHRPLPLPADPLQIELEKICKEVEQTTKLHDSTKLQYKSECEKEIEEMIAQIRRKYEAKLRDAEGVFLLKKTELEANHKKVLMNKMLAEAFRSKCLDHKTSATSSRQQGVPVSCIQRPSQSSLRRHSSAATSSPAGLPLVSQQTVMPPLQSLHRSSGLIPNVPARPPQISAITPSTGCVRVTGDKRAPAPHLQPFRPPGSTLAAASSSSTPCNIPCQPVATNLPARSLSLPTAQNQQLPQLHSQLLLQQNPSPPSQPAAALELSRVSEAVTDIRPSQSESGFEPGSHNPLSAVGLLMDIDNQAGGHLPNILQHLAGSGLNVNALDLSVARTPGNVDHSLKLPAMGSNVVCLSDDDDD